MLIFDATALGALLDADPPVYRIWQQADLGHLVIGVPTLAIVAAGGSHDVGRSAWDALLWAPTIEVLALTGTVAAEIAAWSGEWHARQALWESRELGWPILTRDRNLYGAGARVLEI